MFKHILNSCITITIKAYSENEAKTMLNSYINKSDMYILL